MGKLSRRWQFGWCEYLEMSRCLLVQGRRSDLRGKPLDVLQILLTHAETVVPNETLIQLVWGNASRQSLTVAISKLRKAFGGGMHDLIQNVSAEGYRMAVPVHMEAMEESAPPALTLEPGDRIPRNANWIAVQRLGGPDHGPVWLARNAATGEQRVYKFATDGVRLRTLQREATVAGILGRSGAEPSSLRRIDDWNFSEQPYYIAGEYVGPNLLLFSKTTEFAAMNRAERIALVATLCDSVAAAHAVGVLHNDLKPSNVLVRRPPDASGKGAPGRYSMVLIDFGDSSLLHESLGGTPETDADDNIFDLQGYRSATTHSEMYRAPELRLESGGSVEADIYSLGVILYQTVLGDFLHVPAAGWQTDIHDALLEEDIARAAHRDPHGRFRTAAAMAEALHSLESRRATAAEAEQARMHMLQVQRDLDRARAARPWVAAALVAMARGILISGWFYRAAVRERNRAQRENRSLEAMLTFLSEDVLAQSNPGSGVAGSSRAVDLTLSGAIRNAEPQIERRFPQDPMIAGRLHETIADGLRARTQFVDADRQYWLAADAYRAVGGPLSQEAIAVELKRDATSLAGQLPGAVSGARGNFEQQQALIRQLPKPTPVVLALRDFVESGLIGLESDPAKAIPLLQRAVQLAKSTPGFDPMLLLWIKGRLCGLYVRLQDGPRLQAAAQDRIQEISARFGKDSPMLVSYEMYLQEAYFLQGKYREAIEQADRNFPRFQRLLGEQNQYTLAVLANRAASLAQLGRYPEAVADDLRLYTLEANDPSGIRMKIGSLSDAALFACRAGQFHDGLRNAQMVLHDAGPGPNSMPAFFSGAKYVVAECMVGEQEVSARANQASLEAAQKLLQQVDAKVITQQTGDQGYAAFVDLANARLAVLRGDDRAAAQSLTKVDSFFAQPGNDPYESQQYHRIREHLASVNAASAGVSRSN